MELLVLFLLIITSYCGYLFIEKIKIKKELLKILEQLKQKSGLTKIDSSIVANKELKQLVEIFNSMINEIEDNYTIMEGYFNKDKIANFIITPQGKFGKVNKVFEEITEYTQKEVQKMMFYEFVHPDNREEVIDRGMRRLKGEYVPAGYECKIISKTGKIKWVLLINTHIYLKRTKENIMLGTAIEITEQKKLFNKLNEQYNLFKTLIESLDIPVWVFDTKKNTFQVVNKKFYEFYEIEEDIIGKTPANFFSKEVFEKAIETNKKIITTKQTLTFENILKLKKGIKHTFVHKSPVLDKNGNVVGIIGTSFDITDKLHMEKEIAKVRNLESLGILAGGIAHDFNNILTAIYGNISLLEMYIKQGKSLDKIIERLENAINRAQNLTKKLMTFSKGSFLLKESTKIEKLIKSTVDFILTGTSIEVNYNIEKNLPDIVVDKSQISEVLHNIILNARQSMEESNGKYLLISVKKVFINKENTLDLKEGEFVKIEIKDSGKGIPEEVLDKIFEPYFTTKDSGSGLGLATSYSIVKQHRGTITVKSELNKGSTFTIYLPVIIDKLEIKKIDKNIQNLVTKKLKILILEDEEYIRSILKEIFDLMGHDCHFAIKGEEMLQLYKKDKYDLIICDMTIKGGMGGLETIKKLRESNPEIYAVVTTGYSASNVIEEYKKYGFRDILLKPFNIEKINEIINKYFVATKNQN